MKSPNPFPNVICWATEARSEVMNTMALDVRPEVFAATHYPSLILEGTPASEQTSRLDEAEYVRGFLDENLPHVLDVAVGDSGTGKSHFIRWVYHRALHNSKGDAHRFHVKLIPRSNANLADIVLDLVKEFHGNAIDQLKKELEQSRNRTTTQGAANRVLDEYAFILDPANREGIDGTIPDDVDRDLYQEVLELLPSFLRDQEVRNWLISKTDSIVMTLARHVTNRRDSRQDLEDIATRLAWNERDLEVPPQLQDRTGQGAKELASVFINDDAPRRIAARILRDAFGDVSSGLLGLKRGDLKRAIIEVRRQLKEEGKELVLLIEDMSVAHGLDHDLLEALIVRTRDAGGGEICKLRSLIGVTNNDYVIMPDNMKGRIRQVLSFNVRFGNLNTTQNKGAEIGRRELVDFASRYLNAVRYSLAGLKQWFDERKDDKELESYCTASGCPNYSQCHRIFGQREDRGLYPFTEDTLVRLYQKATARNTRREDGTAFNPRLMVSAVLDKFLLQAERDVPLQKFPAQSIAENYGLAEVGASTQDAVLQAQRNRPELAARLLTAIELYASRPSNGTVAKDILDAFSLPMLPKLKGNGDEAPPESPRKPESGSGRNTVAEEPERVPPLVTSNRDEFDRWSQPDAPLAQDLLNKWRIIAHSAIVSFIDWDDAGLGSVEKLFERRHINFEGQVTGRAVGGVVVLEIKRSPQAAIALRGLKTNFQAESDSDRLRMLELAGVCVRRWALAVIKQLQQAASTTEKQLQHAAEFLALGAVLRGELQSNTSEANALAMALKPWVDTTEIAGSQAWQQLHSAYRKYAGEVRDWIVEQTSCRKGGRAGDFIDPTTLLPAIRMVRKTGWLSKDALDAAKNGQLEQSCGRLAELVVKALAGAVAAERKNALFWKHAVDGSIGTATLADLCRRLRKAAEKAAELDAFGGDAAGGFTAQCTRFMQKGSKYDEAYAAVSAVEGNAAEGDLLRSLAAMDRTFMADLLVFLQDARTRCQGTLIRIRNETSTIPNLDALQKEVSDQIVNLQTELAKLRTEER